MAAISVRKRLKNTVSVYIQLGPLKKETTLYGDYTVCKETCTVPSAYG